MPLDPSDPIYNMLHAGDQAQSSAVAMLAKLMKQYSDTGQMAPLSYSMPSFQMPPLAPLGVQGLRQIQSMMQPQGRSLASLLGGMSAAPEPGLPPR